AFCRPALADTGADFSGYEVIFLGFPVWWYSIPAIIRSFMEAYDFSGKVIVPFATSGSSGMGRSSRDIQRLCPGAKVQPGKLLNGQHADGELKAWMDKY
ncbi:MAG: flavodoxin, partial [Candidatus Limivicinus sp.]|nr:flavodoxin [Candidatus Limivicinus sp.]